MSINNKSDKIAVPSTGETADSLVSRSFGRSPFIIIYDKKCKEYLSYENTGAKLQDGSGIKAADLLIRNKTDVLLTIELGRKAYSILSKEHIDIRLLKSAGTVNSVINKFLNE